MKTKVLLTQTVLMVVMATVSVGCSSGSGSGYSLQNGGGSSSPTTTSIIPTSTTQPGTTTTTTLTTVITTNTVTFVPDSNAVMSAYVATHPVNNPQNIQLTVNVAEVSAGSNQFGGNVQLSYSDTGNNYVGNFITGTGTVQVSGGGLDTGKSVAAFNQWFTFNGNKVFHGFFQDQYGAVILVIDSLTSTTGDGLAPDVANGSLWFKNFTPTMATQSPEMCWFIQIGPYNCRTFLNASGAIVTTSALYPANGYQRLGTFTGLNIKKAFNQ